MSNFSFKEAVDDICKIVESDDVVRESFGNVEVEVVINKDVFVTC